MLGLKSTPTPASRLAVDISSGFYFDNILKIVKNIKVESGFASTAGTQACSLQNLFVCSDILQHSAQLLRRDCTIHMDLRNGAAGWSKFELTPIFGDGLKDQAAAWA
jgi:hypothetical protein